MWEKVADAAPAHGDRPFLVSLPQPPTEAHLWVRSSKSELKLGKDDLPLLGVEIVEREPEGHPSLGIANWEHEDAADLDPSRLARRFGTSNGVGAPGRRRGPDGPAGILGAKLHAEHSELDIGGVPVDAIPLGVALHRHPSSRGDPRAG